MSVEENKRIARRLREELVTNGDPTLAEELLTEDYVYHGPDLLGEIHGREGFVQMLAGFTAALSGQRETVEDQVAEGDRVTQRFVHRSTHSGELMGAAPTGKSLALSAIEIHRMAEGKIAETWIQFDALSMLQQAGALPVLTPAAR